MTEGIRTLDGGSHFIGLETGLDKFLEQLKFQFQQIYQTARKKSVPPEYFQKPYIVECDNGDELVVFSLVMDWFEGGKDDNESLLIDFLKNLGFKCIGCLQWKIKLDRFLALREQLGLPNLDSIFLSTATPVRSATASVY